MNNCEKCNDCIHKKMINRMLPNAVASYIYLSNYVSMLLGTITDEEFDNICENIAVEYDNVISVDEIKKMYNILMKVNMNETLKKELDLINIAGLLNVNPDKLTKLRDSGEI